MKGIDMIETLIKMYEAEVLKAKTNIDVYINNPVGIGEHPDLVSAVDEQVSKMAEAQDKIDTLKKFYPATPYDNSPVNF